MLALLALMLSAPSLDEKALIDILSDVTKADGYRYAAKDDKGAGLDCLKVEQVGPKSYIGVHHSLKDGVFELRLVESSDLLNWKHVVTLDSHAHQGTIYRYGKRWILAWEKDGPEGNWIHVAGYDSLDRLQSAQPAKTFDIPRTLSPAAEGTPNIRPQSRDLPWEETLLEIGFHYYRNRDVDRQASGTLAGFKDWQCKPFAVWNEALESTYRGNIGDRDQFAYGGRRVTILEGQLRKHDWASWRILLLKESGEWQQLAIKSHKGSTSFANPSVTSLTLPNGKPGMAVSYFVPSQGSAEGESGELVFYRELAGD
ncbi:MAG: hypothetical protein KF784_09085 [Fimbriimonadaceae bacterium]|nr:hypothetical protein [Fimbriimonadaceae bacterium]